ncbi:hypothetical protein POTOM_020865 [Populus tomentosa]|uniref:Uncharacterized protein n=1 Tax=Populus tomentosa TaxID=118781 RepID=A0A8X7ZSZ4_POPTO|nr:hypothetical protein POTOM_020865 [Populus tomentosa]
MDLVFLVQIKELRLQVSNLQLHLYMAEERLRPDKLYEAHPLKFTSILDLESFEKTVLDTMARLQDRMLKYISRNPVSTYDPSNLQMQKWGCQTLKMRLRVSSVA